MFADKKNCCTFALATQINALVRAVLLKGKVYLKYLC